MEKQSYSPYMAVPPPPPGESTSHVRVVGRIHLHLRLHLHLLIDNTFASSQYELNRLQYHGNTIIEFKKTLVNYI